MNQEMTAPSAAPTTGWLLALGALIFVSALGCALLVARIWFSGSGRHLYLLWNLILAWLPLMFALAAVRLLHGERPRRGGFVVAAAAWLLFFPNAIYLFTDLVHLGSRERRLFWVDVVLLSLFALTGFVLAFLSLHLMQRQVARRWGWPAGWLFAIAVAGLGGFGVYLGRFFRWNSWDALLEPDAILADMTAWILRLPQHPEHAAIPVLFALLSVAAHVLMSTLTRLNESGTCRWWGS
jgi:uncharacterized membrane protein